MERMRVRDIMTSPAIVISSTTTVPEAMALMKKHHIRHLPVVEDSRLVGMISRGDLREASMTASVNADYYELHFMLSQLTVSRLMSHKVFTITPDALLVHAAELMTENKIAGLPVVDEKGGVVGIVTDSDLLRTLALKLREAEEATAE